jgi:hypothetical protein
MSGGDFTLYLKEQRYAWQAVRNTGPVQQLPARLASMTGVAAQVRGLDARGRRQTVCSHLNLALQPRSCSCADRRNVCSARYGVHRIILDNASHLMARECKRQDSVSRFDFLIAGYDRQRLGMAWQSKTTVLNLPDGAVDHFPSVLYCLYGGAIDVSTSSCVKQVLKHPLTNAPTDAPTHTHPDIHYATTPVWWSSAPVLLLWPLQLRIATILESQPLIEQAQQPTAFDRLATHRSAPIARARITACGLGFVRLVMLAQLRKHGAHSCALTRVHYVPFRIGASCS